MATYVTLSDGRTREFSSSSQAKQALANAQAQGYTGSLSSNYSGDTYSGERVYTASKDPMQKVYDDAYGSYSKGLGSSQPVAQQDVQSILEKERAAAAARQEQLVAAQKAKAIADLQKAYQGQIGSLTEARSQIDPRYRQAAIQTGINAELAQKRLREQMAAQGLARSGESAAAQIGVNTATQSNLGLLEQQRQSEYDALTRNEALLKQGYESDVASTNAGIEARALEQAIQDARIAEQNAIESARIAEERAREDAYNQEKMGFEREKFEEDKRRYGQEYALEQQKLRKSSSGGSTSSPASITSAESRQNYYDASSQVQSGIEKGATKESTLQYIEQLKGLLTSSDYLKLIDMANKAEYKPNDWQSRFVTSYTGH